MTLIPQSADNDNFGPVAWGRNPRILEWLNRFTQSNLAFDTLSHSFDRHQRISVSENSVSPSDDWQTVFNICGYSAEDFISAAASLPITTAEVEHFRRNHRGTESYLNRDFLTSRNDLPSPLAELYGLYVHRVRVDAEATLFLAQATHSTRVARVMADLLAIGGFANGMEFISHLGLTYAVPAAFDTSDVIDRANQEALRRLTLPADHPSHLLKLTPDEIGALATNIAEKYTLNAVSFLEKSNLLAEARQDVNRLPADKHFVTSFSEGDLPQQEAWTMRICTAYSRIVANWVAELPEAKAHIQ